MKSHSRAEAHGASAPLRRLRGRRSAHGMPPPYSIATRSRRRTRRDPLRRAADPRDGRLTDGHGRTVDFSGTVLLMTTNLGSADAIAELTRSGRGPRPRRARRAAASRNSSASRCSPPPDGAGGLGCPELWSRLQGAVTPFDVVRRERPADRRSPAGRLPRGLRGRRIRDRVRGRGDRRGPPRRRRGGPRRSPRLEPDLVALVGAGLAEVAEQARDDPRDVAPPYDVERRRPRLAGDATAPAARGRRRRPRACASAAPRG